MNTTASPHSAGGPVCTDPDIGRYLEDYEMDALEARDKERFELHLFECACCFARVRRFASAFEALRMRPEELFRLPAPDKAVDKAPQTSGSEALPPGETPTSGSSGTRRPRRRRLRM